MRKGFDNRERERGKGECGGREHNVESREGGRREGRAAGWVGGGGEGRDGSV